jgi:hypothetical protein
MIPGLATKRLPGVRFEAQAPPLAETLPRMDIAFFAGFAASGPLHTPVAVESAAQFEAIFGDDAPLAWDGRRGATLRAYLAPAVRAFFRNGGRRCWVMRVARQKAGDGSPLDRARANYFPIPGMARAAFTPDGETITRVTPAFARARSEGSWSDGLRVSATLESRPFQVIGAVQKSGDDLIVELERVAPNELATGDLLRLSFGQGAETLMLVVRDIEFIAPSPLSGSSRRARASGRQAIWFRPFTEESPPPSPLEVKARIYTRETTPPTLHSFDADQTASLISGFERECEAELQVSPPAEPGGDPVLNLKLRGVSASDAPEPGSLARVDVNGDQLWLTVNEQGISQDGAVTLRGQGMWHVKKPASLPAATPAAERLSFDLWARLQEKYASSLPDLAFADGHASFWGSQLPDDDGLFGDALADPAQTPAIILRPQVGDLFRFPLAGLSGEREVCFPLGMQALPENYLGAVGLPGSKLERDGLASFDADLFLDEGLIDTRNEGLLAQADFIRYLSPAPRKLRGIHAALEIDEATIIAAPDAVHVGWLKREAEKPPEPLPSPPPPRPEWLRYAPCRPAPEEEGRALRDCEQIADESPKEGEPPREPRWENFLDCSIRVIAPQALSVEAQGNDSGAFTLLWTSPPPDSEEAVEYTLEESVSRDFSGAEVIYAGKETRQTIIGRQPGNYYYRVKAKVGRDVSDWSNGVVVQVASASGWAVKPVEDYDSRSLFAVQRALLRMCAARGDLFAALSLPEHYRREKAVEHLRALRSKGVSIIAGVAQEPLDDRTLSFGAVWGPWPSGREENRLDEIRSAPPCGAICGTLAKRALARGAWVAAANEPLRDVVALTPPVLRDDWLELQEERINLIRQEPRGFLSLDSDTLSDDADLRQINVRRLLSLLRRLALKLGATYVFEPHSQVFRRSVKRGFEALLNQMFTRGAFAGATPAASYQVVVDESLNTPQSMEQGRFIVELRVAPSLPLRFLTIRLVQGGDRGFVQEV